LLTDECCLLIEPLTGDSIVIQQSKINNQKFADPTKGSCGDSRLGYPAKP
jgi:hypothetical protein